MSHFHTDTTQEIIGEISDDILIRFDRNGFILQISGKTQNFDAKMRIGLFPFHVADLTTREYAAFLNKHVRAAISGRPQDDWAEFPAANWWAENKVGEEERPHWYGLNVRPVYGANGEIDGALGLLRSMQELRDLESELRASFGIEPITGLVNRRTFNADVQRRLNSGGSHVVVLLAVDAMRALRFRYGQFASDEMLWGFASFLKTMALPEYALGHLNSEHFGVLMPNTSEKAARNWSEDVIRTFGGLAQSHSAVFPKISASAGVSPVRISADWSLREAEVGLILSRSGGGNQVSSAWPRQAA